MHAAAVRRTHSNRTRRSAARLAIAAEFSVDADAASQNRALRDFGLYSQKVTVESMIGLHCKGGNL